MGAFDPHRIGVPTLHALADNRLMPPFVLRIFCRLTSGPAWVATAVASAGVATGAFGSARAAQDGDWVYVVQRGDTLSAIAARYLQSPSAWRPLARLNKIKHPRRLRINTPLHMPVAWLRAQASQAELAEVVGDVSLRLADGSTPAAAVGLVLRTLDTVSTGAGASATLRFADGSLVLLTPNSKLTLQDLQIQNGNGTHNTTLQLHQGGAEAQVRREPPRPRFEIKSPALNMGARGTEFRARFDPTSGKAHGEVTSGAVAAAGAAQREVQLGNGFGITAAAGALGSATALLPAPDLNGVTSRLQHLPLHLAWAPMAAAQAWRAQIFEASNNQRLLLEGRFDTPQANFADLPDGDYVLRVRAADAQGLEGSVARTNFTLKARPEPPFLREPLPGAVRIGDRTRFVWTLSSAAAQYRLQIAANPDFASPLLDRADLAGPSIDVPQTPGRWYWRLASLRAGGDQGPWSDAQNYELQAVPPPAPPVSEGVKVEGQQVHLRWAAGEVDDRFEFQIAKDTAFSALVAERRIGEPRATLEAPPPGRYYVRSRTVDPRGLAGPWGATNEFEVGYPLWWWLAPALLLLLL